MSSTSPNYRVKESLELVKSTTLVAQGLVSELVSPKTRLSFKPRDSGFSMATQGYVPGFLANQTLPTQDDLLRYTHTYIPSKKRSPDNSPSSRFSSRRARSEVTDVGRITLHRAKTGEHLGQPWYPEACDIPRDIGGATRYSARPSSYGQTYHKLFPTNKLAFSKIPTTTAQRFNKIDPTDDPDLANYVVKAENVFRTTWSKQNDLKDRQFFPEQHAEFTGHSFEHTRKRDRVVDYRESMLKVKSMMNTAWGGKK